MLTLYSATNCNIVVFITVYIYIYIHYGFVHKRVFVLEAQPNVCTAGNYDLTIKQTQ